MDFLRFFITCFLGKCVDEAWDSLKKANEEDLREQWASAVSDATRKIARQYASGKWDDAEYKAYLRKAIINDRASIATVDVEMLAGTYLKEKYGISIDEQLCRELRDACFLSFAQNQDIVNYYFVLDFQRKAAEEQRMKTEHEQLFTTIKNALKAGKKADMYRDLDFLNRTIYPYLCDHLTDGCSEELLEIAYKLADIYDYTSEYEKSMKLAGLIRDIIAPSKVQLSGHHIRQLVGCIYSYIIPKIPDMVEKERMLSQAEADMEVARGYIDDWKFESNAEALFVKALFASDYGALLINKAICAHNRGNEDKEKEFLQEALSYQKEGERLRQELLEHYIAEADTEKREEIERYFYKSKSNVAEVYYHMGDYDRALQKHREVLTHRLKCNEMTTANDTKRYMIGCYAQKAEADAMRDEDWTECQQFINDCEKYYKENGNTQRLKEIRDKKTTIEDLYEKHRRHNTPKEKKPVEENDDRQPVN